MTVLTEEEKLASISLTRDSVDDCATVRRLVHAKRWPQVVLIEAGTTQLGRTMALYAAAAHFCAVRQACLSCPSCKAVFAQTVSDLYLCETDEAMLKIADVEEFRGHFMLKSLSADTPRTGVLISAEKLNMHAANSLLKCLEEAPQGSLILLTTDRPLLVLDTIKSRCVHWRLKARPDAASYAEIDPGVKELLSARNEADLVTIAENLTRKSRMPLAELIRQAELALHQAYHEHNVAIIGSFTTMKERRKQLSRLKAMAVTRKINLNAQLSAESIGLR